jgi:hypothetical protein
VALAKGCQKLVVISDSLPAVESLFSVELQSGQIFSLDCCRAVGPWLAGDPERSVHLWFMPSHMEFFFFFFKSTIYNAGLNRSPRAHNTNRTYSKTMLRNACY